MQFIKINKEHIVNSKLLPYLLNGVSPACNMTFSFRTCFLNCGDLANILPLLVMIADIPVLVDLIK